MTRQQSKSTPSTTERAGQPIAPAPAPVLLGVAAFAVVGFLIASTFRNDWVAIGVCMVVLTAAAIVLDRTGRARAQREPNERYLLNRLPTDHSKLRPAVIVVTLAALVGYVSLTVEPDEQMWPFPFFLAAGFLFLLLPQLLARRALRKPAD